ncbi:hypothetical protein JA1_004320 [Spathaspora sp. JA1]|nr:hypothetical protein JA1_004320 [Spathaspora sp. JA1]
MSTNRVVNIRDQENSAAANIPGKNLVNKENSKVNPPRISKIQRIPLGGKNQNSNNLTLNRSQSSLGQRGNVPLAKDTFRPPALTKSNSTLGFIPPSSAFNQHITVQRDIPPTTIQPPKQVDQPLHQRNENQVKQEVAPVVQNLQQKPQTNTNKRLLLPSIKNELPAKRIKLDISDSLVKPSPIERKPLNVTLRETFSSNTDRLHASNIIEDDITRNNVDPIKKQTPVTTNLPSHLLENEVEITPSIREVNQEQYPIEPLNEFDLKFFSTPNNSNSEFNRFENNIGNAGIPDDISLEMSFETDNTDIEHEGDLRTIQHDANFDHDSEIGLSIADLHTLLD